jgi:hypothetical protein
MSDDRTMPQDGDEIEVTEAMSEAGAQVISDWMNQDREISRALSIEVFRLGLLIAACCAAIS